MVFKPIEQVIPNERRVRKEQWRAHDSIALVACMHHEGCVLAFHGQCIEADFEAEGSPALDCHGMDDAPDGLSIWEGKMEGGTDYWTGEPDYMLEGDYRELTDREWELFRTTGEPWEYES